MDHELFVEEYGAAIEAGQASLLIGTGMSSGAGYPNWADLLEPVAEEFDVPPMGDLPLRAQYIETKAGRDRLSEHLAAAIGAVVPIPLENHVLIAQLGVRDVWTTNYDPLLETADPEMGVVERDEDLVDRAGRERRLKKMHGSIPFEAKAPVGGRDQLVLSRDDYEHYERTHPRLWRLLQAQFLTSSFLFVGFSMTDPNFEAVFRIARLATADKLMPHYVIMKRPADDGTFDFQAEELRKAGVELVEIADYSAITSLLQKLIARTRPAGLFVSGSARKPGDADSTTSETYPTVANNEPLDAFAGLLGPSLALAGVPSLVAAGDLGARVGYSFLDGLDDYESSRFVLVRRRSDEEIRPQSLRQGQIHFIGELPDIMRSAALRHVRAVVVLGGGPGTQAEAERAMKLGMTVIPVAHTGGAARVLWEEMMADPGQHHAGQRTIDTKVFSLLDSDDSQTAIEAVMALVQIGLFLPSSGDA